MRCVLLSLLGSRLALRDLLRLLLLLRYLIVGETSLRLFDLAGDVSRFCPKEAIDAPPVRRLDRAAMAESAAAFCEAELAGRPGATAALGLALALARIWATWAAKVACCICDS